MDVKEEAGAAGFLDSGMKIEEENSVGAKEGAVEEGGPLAKMAGRSCVDMGHKVKQELEENTSGNWDARLQAFVETLQAPPSLKAAPQLLDRKPYHDPERSPGGPHGTGEGGQSPQGLWGSPKQPCLLGDIGEESSSPSLGKDQGGTLAGKPGWAEQRRQRFRTVRYQDTRGPREVCRQLRECCCKWLEPERRTKEQMVDLVALEQFVAVLPLEMQSWVQEGGPVTCAQAVTLAEAFLLRQPEAENRESQVTGSSEEHFANAPRPRATLPGPEKRQLPTENEHGCKGAGNLLGDGWLREDKERKAQLCSLEQSNRPTVSMETGQENDFLCHKEAEENQRKAEGPNGDVTATGADQPVLIQGVCEGITRPTAQEEEEEEKEEKNGVKDEVSREEPLLTASEDPEMELKLFQCWHCGQSFSSSVKLVTHERSHVGEKLYTCLCCGQSERTHTGQKPHKCLHCGKTFGWSPQERLHGGEAPHVCPDCGKSCSQRSDLLKHQRTHTGEKPYHCSVCGKSFRNGSGLKVHQRIHTGEKPYKCSHCGKRFSWSSHFASHERIHAAAVCSHCGKSFGQKAELAAHEETHAAEETLSCFACGKAFGLASELAAHARAHKEKPFACAACGKTFRNGLQRLAHQKVHTGEKQHKCAHCGSGFSQRQKLVFHERTHTGEKPHPCPVCGKRFRNLPNLKSHERTHTGEKPYGCAHCEKTFRWSSQLALHERSHTGEKPHRCADCGRAFDRRSNLLVHARVHTGQRPYVCATCGKSFASSSVLLRHQKVHREEEACSCSECGKTFHRRRRPGRADPAPKCSECLGSHDLSTECLARPRTLAEEKRFECSACGKAFRNSSHLITHQSVHRGVQPSRCADCGRNIVRRPNLISAAEDQAGPKPHQCSGCQKRSSQISIA